MGEQSPEDSLSIVQRLYNFGAVRVQAVKIDREPSFGETTNIVCLELPAASSARQKPFKTKAAAEKTRGKYPPKVRGGIGIGISQIPITTAKRKPKRRS